MQRKTGHSMAILLTGIPCTGKTSLARAWCKKSGWAFLSLNELVEKKKLYSGIDKEDGSKIVKLKALEKEANKRIKALAASASKASAASIPAASSSILVEGHLGCEIRLKVGRVLVLRLRPDELGARLKKRHYSRAKISENRLAEMLDYCTVRSIQNYGEKNVYELDGSGKSLKQNLEAFGRFAGSLRPAASFLPRADWSAQLFREAG